MKKHCTYRSSVSQGPYKPFTICGWLHMYLKKLWDLPPLVSCLTGTCEVRVVWFVNDVIFAGSPLAITLPLCGTNWAGLYKGVLFLYSTDCILKAHLCNGYNPFLYLNWMLPHRSPYFCSNINLFLKVKKRASWSSNL